MFGLSRFKLDTLERTVRTVVQSIAGAVLAVVVGSGGWDALDWNVVWKTGAFAGLLAVLFALSARNVGANNTAAFVDPAAPAPPAKPAAKKKA